MIKRHSHRPEDEVTEEGCGQLAITAFEEGVFGRGIVMDFPRLRGVDWLENGTAITPDWLDEWEAQNNIRVGAGDIVLIRTGRWARRRALGSPPPSGVPWVPFGKLLKAIRGQFWWVPVLTSFWDPKLSENPRFFGLANVFET